MTATLQLRLQYVIDVFDINNWDMWSIARVTVSRNQERRRAFHSAQALESYLKFLDTFNPSPAFMLRWIHFGEPSSQEPLWWFSNSIRPTHFMQRTLGIPNLEMTQ